MHRAFFAASAVLLAGFTQAHAATAQPQVLAAWSQIIGETDATKAAKVTPPKIELRFVVEDGKTCADFDVAPDAGAKPAASPVERDYHLKAGQTRPLTVGVCQFRIPDAWTHAHLMYQGKSAVLTSLISYGSSDKDLQPIAQQTKANGYVPGPSDGKPVIVKGPAWIGSNGELRLISLGDTGCRGRPSHASSRQKQYCDSQAGRDSWPLAPLSTGAANLDLNGTQRPPDLVVHVGDYRYFYENEITTDRWDLWQKDFFPAAQPLLLAAPWAFGRGNHEHCVNWLRFGGGYLQLFGANAGQSCGDIASRGDFMRTWFFDVGVGGASDGNATNHRFVMIDTNKFGDRDAVNLDDEFEDAFKMSKSGPESSWWVTHTPGIQLIYYYDSGRKREHIGEYAVREGALTAAETKQTPSEAFCGHKAGVKCRPNQFLMGHQHLYQDVVFKDSKGDWVFPRQIIVGHGGTKVDNASPARGGALSCLYQGFPIGMITGKQKDYPNHVIRKDVSGLATTVPEHGLVVWTRGKTASADQSGWTPSYVWAYAPDKPQPTAGTAPSAIQTCHN